MLINKKFLTNKSNKFLLIRPYIMGKSDSYQHYQRL